MCGIAGVARLDGGTLGAGADDLLAAMADLLAHRGPDERELLRDGPVGLAFQRLSLVDPRGGSQPLVSADGSVMLIANGEVYNHRELAARLPGTRLRTGSDCEVLLYLYRAHGLHFLDEVRGMFGLILLDQRDRRLILARDRFGIKPLYYHRNADRIVFGSQITSLFADPATPRRLDWHTALAMPVVTAAPMYNDDAAVTTWFEGIETVPAATILQIDLNDGRTSQHRYWEFPGTPATGLQTPADFIARYRELLVSSVQECATADAELGVFLSGGIDSASVAAIAAEHAGSLHTFTVLGPSTYRGDAEHGHRVAQKLGLPNHQVLFGPDRVPGAEEWKRLLWLSETPLCGPEVYYKHELHRYAKAARPQLRGMLLGAASDEFNGGYSFGASDGAGWESYIEDLRARVRLTALRKHGGFAAWWTYCEQPLLTDDAVHELTGVSIGDPYPVYSAAEYWKIQQYNCWHEDRTAAGSGIEARVPFLDHRLVELVLSVPVQLREQLLWDKRILREAMRGILPDDVIERPKGHFFYEDGVQHTYRWVVRMLTQENASLIEQALAAPGADRYLDRRALMSAAERLAAHLDSSDIEILLRAVNLGLLAGMAACLPRPTARTPIGQAPTAVVVRDWDAQQEQLQTVVGLRPPVPLAAVPRLAASVLLLASPGTPDWYLAVDGTIEYVLTEDEPEVLRLLRAIDASATIAEILTVLDSSFDEVYPIVADLMDKGIIQLDDAVG